MIYTPYSSPCAEWITVTKRLCVLVCLQSVPAAYVCITVGEDAAEAFTLHTTGENGSYYPHCDCPQMCACVSLLDAFCHKILLMLETKSTTKQQKRPMITSNDTATYMALVSEATKITPTYSLFGQFLVSLKLKSFWKKIVGRAKNLKKYTPPFALLWKIAKATSKRETWQNLEQCIKCAFTSVPLTHYYARK